MRSHFVQARITPAVIARLQEQYPTFQAEPEVSGTSLSMDTSGLSDEQIRQVGLDLEFFERNPTLPLENLCAHLDTYHPGTPSQTEMLEYARRLAALNDDGVGAGLYMWGEAGIGKSHISVGLAKEFMDRGMDPIFMTADTYSFDTHLRLEPGQSGSSMT